MEYLVCTGESNYYDDISKTNFLKTNQTPKEKVNEAHKMSYFTRSDLHKITKNFKYYSPDRQQEFNDATATKYDAVVDPEDILEIKVQSPLILLNSDKIKFQSISKISKDEIKEAQNYIANKDYMKYKYKTK